MKIIIAGIRHDDPYGPPKVLSLLQSLRESSFIPDCIVTEWDSSVAKTVIAQRPLFLSLAANELLSNKENIALANAIAYEADIHESIYPDLPIIWMDELNEAEMIEKEVEINRFAELRIMIYKSALRSVCRTESILEGISEYLWALGHSATFDARDEKFFKKICEAEKSGYSSVFVLVGAKHADPKIKENLFNMLLDAGYGVEVFILDPSFRFSW